MADRDLPMEPRDARFRRMASMFMEQVMAYDDDQREFVFQWLEATAKRRQEDGAAPDTWRSIDTAPEDGTYVLLHEGGSVFEGRFIEGHGWYERNNDPTDAWGDKCYPTDWRPLPPPPEATTPA